jgi:hypothetical protein
VSEIEREDEFEPALAIPLGSLVGMACGLLVGLTLVDDVGRAMVVGVTVGSLLGTAVYLVFALVVGDEDA